MDKKKIGTIRDIFPQQLKYAAEQAERMDETEEIRVRIGRPVILRKRGKEVVLGEEFGKTVTGRDLEEMLSLVCKHSVYAYEEEIAKGFITIPGGHRVGICGQVTMEAGEVKSFRHVNSMNIRISHQIRGVADSVIPYLYEDGRLCNVLLASAPGGGKTTLLRDVIRQISNGTTYGEGVNVSVIDERSEIGGDYRGILQNDLGIRTDVLTGCPKAQGMVMLLRTMGASVIAVDELGGERDMEALKGVLYSGCRILATIHAGSYEELCRQKELSRLLADNCFQRIVLLQKMGKEERGYCILKGNGAVLAERRKW